MNNVLLTLIFLPTLFGSGPVWADQVAPTSLSFNTISIHRSMVPIDQPGGGNSGVISVQNLTTYGNNQESISFRLDPQNIVVNGMDITIQLPSGAVDLGNYSQTGPGYPAGTNYELNVTNDQYQVAYTFKDSHGLCPNRHDGFFPHACTMRREQFTLRNAANSLNLSCVRWSEVNTTLNAILPFDKTDSGLPSCD